MDEKNSNETDYRRRAIRLTIKGKRPCDILKLVPRSRQWLYKWQRRFEQHGWPGLDSRSRQPQNSRHQYRPDTRAVVLKVRRSLQKRGVGLVGPQAVRREIIKHRLLRPVPGLSTIKRWLKAAGLIRPAPATGKTVYYPVPHLPEGCVLYLMDWAARYIEGGQKVFVFHTLDGETRALHQTITRDKTTASVIRHALESWRRLGRPDFLQIDNDSAFNGGSKIPRRFGQFVRLALYVGIELIFIPPGEPERNGVIESLHGVWSASFWDRNHFRSVHDVARKSPQFID